MTMNKRKNKVLVLVSTKDPGNSFQDLVKIPQIDISMLLPCYPAPWLPLFGLRISAQSNSEINAPYTLFDFLFRVRSFEQFLEVAGKLRPIEWKQSQLSQSILSNPYPIQTVSEDQIGLFLSGLEAGLRIQAPLHRISHC